MLVLLAVFSGSVLAVAPIAAPVTDTVTKNVAKTIALSCSNADAADVGEQLTYEIVVSPAVATGILDPVILNTVKFTPALNYEGDAAFSYKCTDNSAALEFDQEIVSLNIVPPATTISSDEQEYEERKDQYSEYDNDFYSFKRKYERAQDNNDLGELKRYEDKLQDLEDDLDSLLERVDNLEEDVEDTDDRDLLNHIRDLQEDIESLQDKVSRVLDDNSQDLVAQWSDQTASGQTTVPRSTPASTTAVDKPVKVVYEKLELPASTTVTPANTGQESLELSSTQQNYALTILIGGVVIVLAVIIFLLASLLKR